MELKIYHWIGMGIASAIIISSLFLIKTNIFFFLIGVGVLIGASPFVISIIKETKAASEKEEMFIEFSRNLVESVKTGTPISKSIINIRDKQYGLLSPHIKKLSNQINMGIPLNEALKVFSRDVNNKAISRALTLIGQAEKEGGDIGEILESVAGAVNLSDKLKKERKSVISTLVVQGYIIFFVFIVIVLVMQLKIIPMVSSISNIGSLGSLTGGGIPSSVGLGVSAGGSESQKDIGVSFLYLLLVQGFFSGLAIGKLAEGNIKSGIKHSFILILASFLISTGTSLFFG